MSTARPIRNDTTPPPELAMGMLMPSHPVDIDIVEKPTTDWGKIEAYTQGGIAIGAAMKRSSMCLVVDAGMFTHIDSDHFRPANINRFLGATYRASFACKNMALLTPEANNTTKGGVFTIIHYGNQVHLDLAEPSNALWMYTDLLEKIHDPLDGYEQYETSDWDGHGADPITADTLAYARRLMKAIPNTLGTPDAAPAADGCIALEWVPEDQSHKLDRLFIDIGPGEVWRAYWSLRSGEFERVTGQGLTDETKNVLKDIFEKLNA